MKDLVTKVEALMDSNFTNFQTSINACTPDEVDNYSTSSEDDVNAQYFALIHINVEDPLRTSQGHHYQFTVIDRSAHWPEAIPLETASASCTSALLSGWIARFGIPEDNTGVLFSPLNPVANGMVERFHSTLKAALISCCKDSNRFTQLPLVLLGLTTISKDALDVSAAEMVYGDPLIIHA
ncbi:uncharacterized protein [Palaemon carinicauda]|uniref:uncharacterized protein n=1 Tax=Palaemon carinicauda TaxID=392227 RepID=UPI0035B58712